MTTVTEASLRDAQEPAEDELYDPGVDPESEADDSSYPITEFDIVSSPNDFNTKTLVDFIDSDVVVIPGFQRNYVWDIKRASRLIESLVVGLPVPQVFLYERERDEFVLIDGQQRLMSIYYFVKGRFPKKGKRVDLRFSSPERSNVRAELLADDQYFSDFQAEPAGVCSRPVESTAQTPIRGPERQGADGVRPSHDQAHHRATGAAQER